MINTYLKYFTAYYLLPTIYISLWLLVGCSSFKVLGCWHFRHSYTHRVNTRCVVISEQTSLQHVQASPRIGPIMHKQDLKAKYPIYGQIVYTSYYTNALAVEFYQANNIDFKRRWMKSSSLTTSFSYTWRKQIPESNASPMMQMTKPGG